MTRVHVWSASGYAAAEAIRYLDAHPFVEIATLESRSHFGAAVADHFPLLRTAKYRFDPTGATLAALRSGDVVIAAGGHGDAQEVVPQFLRAGARVIDLSADYRFDDAAAYGLTEWQRNDVARASLVANPGCYPTATLLGVLPLQAFGAPQRVIVDAKSGITGAGRNPSVGSLYAEMSGSIRPYGLEGHRHQPEIERLLERHHLAAPLTFTPHVVPLSRGMLVDAYVVYSRPLDASAVHAAYREAYAASPFVRLLDDARAPSVPAVAGTNDAEIRVDVIGEVVRVIVAIDNLGKGAAGQAIQNFNVMLGYPEETGLNARAVVA